MDRQSREAAGDANSAFSTPTHAQGIIGVDNVRPLTPYVELDLYEKSRRECTPKKPPPLPYETRRGHTHTRAETAPHCRCSLGTAPSRVALFIMIAFQIRCCPKKFGKNNDAIALCFLLSLYVGTVALVSTDFLLFII